MAFPDDYVFYHNLGAWFGKDGSGPHFIDVEGEAIPLGTGTLSDKLQSLDDASTPNTVPVIAGASSFDFISLGVTGATSIPQRSHGDSRWLRWTDATFAAGVGEDGDVAFNYTDLIHERKVAGAWVPVTATGVDGATLYDGTYPAASWTNKSKFVTTWGVWTLNEWFWSDGTQWWPESRVLRLGTRIANSTAVTGTLAETASLLHQLPANMARGALLIETAPQWIYTGTNGTKQPKIRFGASGSGTGAQAVFSVTASTNLNLWSSIESKIWFTSNAAQYFKSFSDTNTGGHVLATTTRSAATVDVTAACEIGYYMVLGNVADSCIVESALTQIHFPSLKT